MKLFLIICTIKFISTTDVYPEKVETFIKNSKHIHNLKFTFQKHNRNSPYYIDLDYVATSGYGNNMTLEWQLYENISGRYILIPMQFKYSLCNFLYNDQFFGQMYAKQLVGNWSCPFPPGRSPFRNLILHLDHLPLIPFTYSSLIVRTRADVILSFGSPLEEFASAKLYMTVKQTLKKIDTNTWKG